MAKSAVSAPDHADFRNWLATVGGRFQLRDGGVSCVIDKPPKPPDRSRALASDIASLEADLFYLDEIELPTVADDDDRRPSLVKARAEMIGELLALTEAFEKARPLDGTRVLGPLTVKIENRAGSVRHWTAENGDQGSTTLRHPYGYVAGTIGLDGDELDAFLGPHAHEGHVERTDVHVVTTGRKPDFDTDDEEKAMVGFPSWGEARKAFLDHYGGDERFIRRVEHEPWPMFVQRCLANGAARHAPVHVVKAEPPAPAATPCPEPHRPGWWQRGLLFMRAFGHGATMKLGRTSKGRPPPPKPGQGPPQPAAQPPMMPGMMPPMMGAPRPGGPPGPPKPGMPGQGPPRPGQPPGPGMMQPGLSPALMPGMAPQPTQQARVHPETAIDSGTLAKQMVAHAPALEQIVGELEKLFPGTPVAGRLKETKTVAQQAVGANQQSPLGATQDFAAARVTFTSPDEVHMAADRIRRSMQVVSEDDAVTQPRQGYQSFDVTVQANGTPVEIQLRTPEMTSLGDQTHDQVHLAHRTNTPMPGTQPAMPMPGPTGPGGPR